MIVLDTHVWIWHVQGDKRLPKAASEIIQLNEETGLGVSAFSLWEVAKIIEKGKLDLPIDIEDWFTIATTYPGIQVLLIDPLIAIESTRLPGNFHKDPFDQLIVATARVYDAPLVTADSSIINYPYVKLLPKR